MLILKCVPSKRKKMHFILYPTKSQNLQLWTSTHTHTRAHTHTMDDLSAFYCCFETFEKVMSIFSDTLRASPPGGECLRMDIQPPISIPSQQQLELLFYNFQFSFWYFFATENVLIIKFSFDRPWWLSSLERPNQIQLDSNLKTQAIGPEIIHSSEFIQINCFVPYSAIDCNMALPRLYLLKNYLIYTIHNIH